MPRTKKNKPGHRMREEKKEIMKEQSSQSPEQLFATALQLVEQSQAAEALVVAKNLWTIVQNRAVFEALPALNLLGEISIELGAVDSARQYFEKAVQLDPDGGLPEEVGDGAEKFLWLAQLCEEGGKESVKWYEKGAKALQNEIAKLESGPPTGISEETLLFMRMEKKRKLANTLCGVVEVYMTDLSWEDDAEARCESLITQAIAVEDETSAEVLQTLASVRLSQDRKEDAQSALKRSLETWQDLEPEDPTVPDFATKISLSRLLMEANMNRDAMRVLDRLIQEDDESVEAWYLGGWCQHLMANADQATNSVDKVSITSVDFETGARNTPGAPLVAPEALLRGSRRWLQMSLKLYERQDYEDNRLFDHAQELVADLNKTLGAAQDGDGAEEDAGWEDWDGIDEDEDDDEEEHAEDHDVRMEDA